MPCSCPPYSQPASCFLRTSRLPDLRQNWTGVSKEPKATELWVYWLNTREGIVGPNLYKTKKIRTWFAELFCNVTSDKYTFARLQTSLEELHNLTLSVNPKKSQGYHTHQTIIILQSRTYLIDTVSECFHHDNITFVRFSDFGIVLIPEQLYYYHVERARSPVSHSNVTWHDFMNVFYENSKLFCAVPNILHFVLTWLKSFRLCPVVLMLITRNISWTTASSVSHVYTIARCDNITYQRLLTSISTDNCKIVFFMLITCNILTFYFNTCNWFITGKQNSAY